MTSTVTDSQCNLQKRIQYSRLQVEAAKLRAKGYSETRIADALGVDYRSVHRALKAFEKVGPQIVKDVSELSDFGYWQRIYRHKLRTTCGGPQWKKAISLQEQLVKEGWFPGTPPFGYIRKNDEIVLDPERAKLVEKLFAGRVEGKTQEQLMRETGIASVGRILRNPFYFGMMRWKRVLLPGKHPPIISKGTFESAQIPRDYPISQTCRAPYGYRWAVGRLRKDPEKADKVRQIFLLRAQGKTMVEIARKLGLDSNRVLVVLHHPIYKGVSRNAVPMPSDFEPIVDADKWWAANRVHTRTFKQIREEMRARGKENRRKIIGILSTFPATHSELMAKSGLKKNQVTHTVSCLKREGIILKKGGIHGKWHLIEGRKETAQD